MYLNPFDALTRRAIPTSGWKCFERNVAYIAVNRVDWHFTAMPRRSPPHATVFDRTRDSLPIEKINMKKKRATRRNTYWLWIVWENLTTWVVKYAITWVESARIWIAAITWLINIAQYFNNNNNLCFKYNLCFKAINI